MTFSFNIHGLTPADAQTSGSGGGGGTADPVVVYAGDTFTNQVSNGAPAIETIEMQSGNNSFTTTLTIPQNGYYEIMSVINFTSSTSSASALQTSVAVIKTDGTSKTVGTASETTTSTNWFSTVTSLIQAESGDKIIIVIGGAKATSAALQKFVAIKIA